MERDRLGGAKTLGQRSDRFVGGGPLVTRGVGVNGQLESPALDDYLRELRRTHAGVFVGRWRAQSYSEVAAWFAARNRLEEYEMHRLFFDSPSVRSKLRDLHIPAHLDAVSDGLGEVPGVESCRVVYEHRG